MPRSHLPVQCQREIHQGSLGGSIADSSPSLHPSLPHCLSRPSSYLLRRLAGRSHLDNSPLIMGSPSSPADPPLIYWPAVSSPSAHLIRQAFTSAPRRRRPLSLTRALPQSQGVVSLPARLPDNPTSSSTSPPPLPHLPQSPPERRPPAHPERLCGNRRCPASPLPDHHHQSPPEAAPRLWQSLPLLFANSFPSLITFPFFHFSSPPPPPPLPPSDLSACSFASFGFLLFWHRLNTLPPPLFTAAQIEQSAVSEVAAATHMMCMRRAWQNADKKRFHLFTEN